MNPILFVTCDVQFEGSVKQINKVKKGLKMSAYNPQWDFNGINRSSDVGTIQANSLKMISKKMDEHQLEIHHHYNVKVENIPEGERPFYKQ